MAGGRAEDVSVPSQRRVRRRQDGEHKESDHVLCKRGCQPGTQTAAAAAVTRSSNPIRSKFPGGHWSHAVVTWPWACPLLAGFQYGFRVLRADWFSVAFSLCNADQWGAAEVVLFHFSRLNPNPELYFRSNLNVTNMTVSCR